MGVGMGMGTMFMGMGMIPNHIPMDKWKDNLADVLPKLYSRPTSCRICVVYTSLVSSK